MIDVEVSVKEGSKAKDNLNRSHAAIDPRPGHDVNSLTVARSVPSIPEILIRPAA